MPQNSVKPLHIAIDARMYGTAQRGIGRYLMKLTEQLEIVDKKNQYTIFLRSQNFEEYQPRNPNFKKALWDAPWYGWREQVYFRPLLKIRGRASDPTEARPPDIVHFPHWNVPFFFNHPFIVTIHDLELFSSNRTRENTTRGRLLYALKHLAFRVVFRHAVLAARAIIVPSNVVREQLLDLYPQVRKKVHVIYEAPIIEKLAASKLEARQSPNSKLLAPSSYVLYVGAAYPHKNLPRLLEAWKLVHTELPDYKLVLVGREDFFWKRIKESVIASGAKQSHAELMRSPRSSDDSLAMTKIGGIVFYGSATDAELATLYQNAALLIQPSLEEGFSLPPLEALSFGTSIAVSDIPVHREILKNAPLYFDPNNTQSIADVVLQALQNHLARQNIIACGKELVNQFSWKKHAEETLKLYHQTLSS